MPCSFLPEVARKFRAWAFTGGFLALLLSNLSGRAQVAGAIVVYPEVSSLEVTGTRQFTAYVPISPNTVTWLLNEVPGGNAMVGTISATGLYQPPAMIPANNVLTVTARSTAFPASQGSATLTVTRSYPWLWNVSPASLSVGSYQLTLNGANFAMDSQVLVNGTAVPTTFMSSTKLVATGTAAAAGTLKVSVRQPAPGVVTGNSVDVPVASATIKVTLSPTSANVALGGSLAFSAVVTGTTKTNVSWSVNGVAGGSTATGRITAGGVYTAPTTMPASSTITIRATAVTSPTKYAEATVTLGGTPPPPPPPPPPSVTVAISPTSAAVVLGQTKSFTATVTGTNNTAVTWSVNGVTGGSATTGTINTGGLYTAPALLPSPASVTVRATSVAVATAFASATVTLSAPPPPPPSTVSLSAARFLEQSSFGPTTATLARVQQIGINAYLDEQFAAPESALLVPADNSMGALRQWMLYHYTSAPDQLRQRVAYALSQIVVTSANKLIYADEILPWLRILNHQAFGNYRDLLREVTKSPSMGKYLDLANSMKPGLAGGANENYPRELMQLFSLGLWLLNPDGSLQLDAANTPTPTYTQETVRQVALTLTGWTYATAPGATPQNANWEYFGAPMESRAANHDTSAKSFLGCTVPAGQTVEQDLESLLDCLMTHPNTAPFIATRLIRSLVLSNPSPGYVQRVAAVFTDNGHGVRGDLQAVVRAILLDPEARQDIATANQGRLKEPILHISGFLRALDGGFTSGQQLTYLFDYMAQPVLAPASVFSWFSPLYHVPGSPLFGPEFQIYSPTEAALRGNFFYMVLRGSGGDLTIDLTPYQPYGNDMAGLVEMANQRLLYGRMPAAMKTAIIQAATPGYDAKTRIETVLYLTALTGQYAVQY